MNERIKELIIETLGREGVVASRAFGHWALSDEQLDKFAELIVRECVSQCEQVAVHADKMTKSAFVTDAGRQLHEGMWGGAKNCSVQIKEHFGVEE